MARIRQLNIEIAYEKAKGAPQAVLKKLRAQKQAANARIKARVLREERHPMHLLLTLRLLSGFLDVNYVLENIDDDAIDDAEFAANIGKK